MGSLSGLNLQSLVGGKRRKSSYRRRKSGRRQSGGQLQSLDGGRRRSRSTGRVILRTRNGRLAHAFVLRPVTRLACGSAVINGLAP